MNTSPLVALTSVAALFSAAAGGMMYVFSTFVMRGLDRTGPVDAITAMRGINAEANSNPVFLLGYFGATILALGRALGETIAVTMVIGNNHSIPPSIFAPAYTLSAVIANEFTEATGVYHPAALIELGLVLILVTLIVNVAALWLVRSTSRDVSRAA